MAGFNKMFVMVPVMLAARKLDVEDPNVVYWLRVAYGSVQSIVVLVVIYVYIMASKMSNGMNQVVYVPPPIQPFADPNAKKKYTETVFGAHVLSQARSLLGSTLFGICLTLGLHYYRGMAVGLAIQCIMGPLNLTDNAVVKAIVIGGSIEPAKKIFDEKSKNELTQDDEVVDAQGNPVVLTITNSASGKKSFEDILLDTWDDGAKADLGPLMAAINKKNCNFKTKESGWTPLMILSGLGVKGTASAIRQVMELGGNPAILDVEGWNAMHWAAFHGSVEAAKALRDCGELFTVKDKEGKTPLMHARAEGNDDVALVLEELEAAESTGDQKDEALRKRK